MPDWNPKLYLQFKNERNRASLDLIQHINHPQAAFITDLGCGPGNSTKVLHNTYPSAHITGIDNSQSMLKEAQASLPECYFENADMSEWKPQRKQDIIFANASLQWLSGHQDLIPHFASQLNENGVLAIQMPDNWNEPSHAHMRKIASEFKISELDRESILTTHDYYDLLSKSGCTIDMWRTTYYHVMPSITSIIDWVKGTRLRPYLEKLDEAAQGQFIEKYHRLLTNSYLAQHDGNILMPFPRLFIVARKQKNT